MVVSCFVISCQHLSKLESFYVLQFGCKPFPNRGELLAMRTPIGVILHKNVVLAVNEIVMGSANEHSNRSLLFFRRFLALQDGLKNARFPVENERLNVLDS